MYHEIRIRIDPSCKTCRRCLAAEECKVRAIVRFDPVDTPFLDESHCVICVEGDARRIAFMDNHFVGVILTFSLHHFEKHYPALQEICRILKPSGRVLVGDWVVVK